MNRNNLYSRIQANIGDFIWAKVQREEYYLIFNEVMQELSLQCQFNTIKYEATVPAVGYTHLITLPDTEIYKLEYVKKNGLDCREISSQSTVTAQTNLGRGFHINDTILDKIHYSVRNVNDGLELTFAYELQIDDKIESVLITNQPSNIDSFTDTTKLPYFAYNAIYYGMYSKVLEKLLSLGMGNYAPVYSNSMIGYQNQKMELKAYIRNLKTSTSFPQIQPLKWLSED